MKAKRKGTRAEHKTIRLLERQGYKCTRAGGSLGAWDVIAVGELGVLLCQVKANRWPGTKEMDTLRAFPTPPTTWIRKIVHRWRDYQRRPDVKHLEFNRV